MLQSSSSRSDGVTAGVARGVDFLAFWRRCGLGVSKSGSGYGRYLGTGRRLDRDEVVEEVGSSFPVDSGGVGLVTMMVGHC